MQLRHDATLYVEQPNTVIFLCEFPDALVEPRPRVWAGIEAMVARAQHALQAAGLTIAVEGASGAIHALEALGRVVPRLRGISETQVWCPWRMVPRLCVAQRSPCCVGAVPKQAAGEALSVPQLRFMQRMVTRSPYECGGPTYGGWYEWLGAAG